MKNPPPTKQRQTAGAAYSSNHVTSQDDDTDESADQPNAETKTPKTYEKEGSEGDTIKYFARFNMKPKGYDDGQKRYVNIPLCLVSFMGKRDIDLRCLLPFLYMADFGQFKSVRFQYPNLAKATGLSEQKLKSHLSKLDRQGVVELKSLRGRHTTLTIPVNLATEWPAHIRKLTTPKSRWAKPLRQDLRRRKA